MAPVILMLFFTGKPLYDLFHEEEGEFVDSRVHVVARFLQKRNNVPPSRNYVS
jgi:hypothetical protein